MKPHPQPDHFSAAFLPTNLETGKPLKQWLGEEKQEKSHFPGKRPKRQLQGDNSLRDKKVCLKDFLLNFVAATETAQKLSKNWKSLVKSDSQRHVNNINCTYVLSKALELVFAWGVSTCSVVSCGENPRTHIRYPTKNLAQTRGAGEFVFSIPGKHIRILEQQLVVYVSINLYFWK